MLRGRKIQIDVVKESGDTEPRLVTEILSEREKAEAIKALITFVGFTVAKSVAVCLVANAAGKIAVNRLSK